MIGIRQLLVFGFLVEAYFTRFCVPINTFLPNCQVARNFLLHFYISKLAPHKFSQGPDRYYVPFLSSFFMLFISNDNFHHACAPLFLRGDQLYVNGNELKTDLERINLYYLQLPSEVKAKGRMTFARTPPKDGDFLVGRIWDRFIPNWRIEYMGDLPYTEL